MQRHVSGPDRGIPENPASRLVSAGRPEETDWSQIVNLYDLLLALQPTSVVELNRAVALAMRDGPDAGPALVDRILSDGRLERYHLAHAARADLCRRLAELG